jgi:hypothetical protein
MLPAQIDETQVIILVSKKRKLLQGDHLMAQLSVNSSQRLPLDLCCVQQFKDETYLLDWLKQNIDCVMLLKLKHL